MSRKFLNRENVEGRVYEKSGLALKVTGPTSKNPGTEYIGGKLDIATDEDCMNIVSVDFTYVTEVTSTGKKNATFTVLKNIIESGKTVVEDGKDAASMVKISTSLGLNDFYTNRNGSDELVSAKKNDGGFVVAVSKLGDESTRNTFECDMLINGTRVVEADPEKNIAEDYLIVKGAVFNDFRKSMLPVEFVVKNPGGVKYFDSLDASQTNMIFTKVWGRIECQTTITKREEESAFGEPVIKEYSRTTREWVITGTAKETYEIGDAQNGITTDEIKDMLAARNVYLADIKKRAEEYQASKAATPTPAANVTAAAGGFNF